jgi:hypothetical protein
MKTVTTTPKLLHSTTESNSHLFDDWLDPIETGKRTHMARIFEQYLLHLESRPPCYSP